MCEGRTAFRVELRYPSRVRRAAVLAILLICVAGCGREAPRFSLDNARAHVQMLAGTIGSRPIGTPENVRARQYVVDQLRLFGYDVRVQEMDARRPDRGLTARVANIIAVKAGAEKNAIALVSHYDSHPAAPGAADDGLGVAVSLEAARVLAARDDRRHTLFVLVTDGEEAGLMGAAGLVTDRAVMDRLQAYLNIESTGSGGTSMLFETGPGNGWIVGPWAKSAPHPRGASFAVEVYRRLPNDTDFSILKRRDVPGLNFAATGDSYPYHTARDTPDRLSDHTLRQTGENAVASILSLDARDLSTRSGADQTFFDIGQVAALSWGPVTSWFIAMLSLAAGLLAWFKTLGTSVRLVGLGRWLLDAGWALVGVAAITGAMIGGTWLLRAARTVYHPWYARPDRMFLLLLALGVLAGWLVVRIGALLPARAHGPRHPVLIWSVTLPLWVALAGVTASVAPGAAYLWTLPLLVAGLGLLAVPSGNAAGVRAISVLVLAVAGTLWLRDTMELLRFMVAVLGRMPFVTPVWVFSALMLACGAMVAPPFVAALSAPAPLLRPSFVTTALLVAVVVTAGFAYAAPAYTYQQPQRRYMRVLTEPDASTSTYEVGSQEPGLDLEAGAPAGWYRASDLPATTVPFGPFGPPYVFRATAAAPGPPPAAVTGFTITPLAAGAEVTMTIMPRGPGLTAAFVLPDGVLPARSNFPGVVVRGRWRAIYVAVPSEGVTWRASFRRGVESKLPAAQAVISSPRFPGGSGWQSLPAWLPQEHVVWDVNLAWILKPPVVIAPVAPMG